MKKRFTHVEGRSSRHRGSRGEEFLFLLPLIMKNPAASSGVSEKRELPVLMEFLIDTALLLNVVIPMLTRTLHAGFVRPTSEPAYSTTPSHDHRVISSCRVIPEAKNQLFLGQHDRQTQVQPEIEFLENFIHRIWSSEKSVLEKRL